MKITMKRNSKSKLVKKWYKMHCLLLVIPLIFNLLTFRYSINYIERLNNDRNLYFYTRISKIFEDRINKVIHTGESLARNFNIQEVAALNSVEELTEKQISEIIAEMQSCFYDLSWCFDFYLYYSTTNSLFETAKITSSEQYYNDKLGGIDLSYETWKNWMERPVNDVMVANGENNYTSHDSKFTFLKTEIFSNYKKTYSGSISFVAIIQDVNLSYELQKMIENEAINICIFNKYHELAATTFHSDQNIAHLYSKMNASEGTFKEKINDADMVVNYAVLENGWKIAYCIPASYYFHPTQISTLFLMAFFLILIFGFFATRIIVYKLYSPIKKIAAKIPDSYPNTDELDKIKSTIIDTIKIQQESETLKEQFQKNQTDIYLLKILNNSFNILHDTENSPHLKLPFSQMPNTVVVFSLICYENLFKDDDITDNERYNLLINILKNVAAELFENQNMDHYFLENNGYFVVLTQIDNKEATLILNECLADFLEKIYYYFSLDLSAGVSLQHDSLYELNTAYNEALICLDYINNNPKDNIVFYEDIKAYEFNLPGLNFEKANKIYLYIKLAMKEEALKILYDTINNLKVMSNPILIQYYLRDILNTLTQKYHDYLDNPVDAALLNDAYLLTAPTAIDIKSLNGCIAKIVARLCEKMEIENQSINSNKKNTLANQIQQYIDAHYMSSTFGASSVAQNFNISTAYLSKIFKTVYPEGFVNYTNMLRIQKAKELLEYSDEKIENISKQIGFINVSSFMRLFKKVEGISPGMYRKLKQEDQKS